MDPRNRLTQVFLAKNTELNLSAIRTEQGVQIKHIADALEVCKLLDFLSGSTIVDVGTGGGFPLLPLAIKYPDCQFTGLDARRKKLDAIQTMVSDLSLHNVQTLHSRAEECNQQFDYLTARAVAKIDVLLRRTFHLVKKGGYFIFYKLFTAEEDHLLRTLCGQKKMTICHAHEYQLAGDTIKKILYVIKK